MTTSAWTPHAAAPAAAPPSGQECAIHVTDQTPQAQPAAGTALPPSTGLRLMAVHAHPDDESSKGAGTMAAYAAAGAEVMVVTCTGGEAGTLLNPSFGDTTRADRDIAAVRREEMAEAARILAPGGRLLIVDFASHDREELRTRDAHARLGFSDEAMLGWMSAAGLDGEAVEHLRGGELTVTLWRGTRPGVRLLQAKAA